MLLGTKVRDFGRERERERERERILKRAGEVQDSEEREKFRIPKLKREVHRIPKKLAKEKERESEREVQVYREEREGSSGL